MIAAGTGNDVAVLLDHGAEHGTAVEIDPVILSLGHTVHPTRPYASDRVRTVNADARAFLERDTAKYDVIVLGPSTP